jgi:hypothetical protein
VVFAEPTDPPDPGYPRAKSWTAEEKELVEELLTRAIVERFGGSGGFDRLGLEYGPGFGSLSKVLGELDFSTENPLMLVRESAHPTGSAVTAAVACRRYIVLYDYYFDRHPWEYEGKKAEIKTYDQESFLGHELAHRWDEVRGGNEMSLWINWGETATERGTVNTKEDFAEAVRLYLWRRWDETQNRTWTDDLGEGLVLANKPKYGGRGKDGLMLDQEAMWLPIEKRMPSTRGGVYQVYDRYDFVEYKFTGSCITP